MSIRCPLCGKTFKSAKKHLLKKHNLTFGSENDALRYMYQLTNKMGASKKSAKQHSTKQEMISKIKQLSEEKLNSLSLDKLVQLFSVFNDTKIPAPDAIEYSKKVISRIVEIYNKTKERRILGKLYSLARESNKTDSCLAIVTLSKIIDEENIPYLFALTDYDEFEDWAEVSMQALAKEFTKKADLREKVFQYTVNRLLSNAFKKGQLGPIMEILEEIKTTEGAYEYLFQYIEKYKDEISMLDKVADWWGLFFDSFQEFELNPSKVKRIFKILLELSVGTSYEKWLKTDYKLYEEFLEDGEYHHSSKFGIR